MDRPYFQHRADELEDVFRAHLDNRVVLAQLREELEFRETDRSRQLLREVNGVLEQRIPRPPKSLGSDDPQNQIDMDVG